MDDVKVNLVIAVQGATMMSEQECSKQLRKPIINKRGKYAGKQARDKKGNLLWYYETVPDLTKYNRHEIEVDLPEGGTEIRAYYTRKNKEVRQSINMTEAAFISMISGDMPQGYHAPKNFQPHMPIKPRLDKKTKKWVEGTPLDIQAWRAASIQQRLEWHLNAVASSLGGRVASYTVFD